MGANLRDRVQSKSKEVARPEPEDGVESSLMKLESKFAAAMPRGKEAQQLVRDAIQVVRKTPKLAQCSFPSVAGALMTCAQLGLRPGIGALGEAHILPFYNNKATWVDENGRERTGMMEATFVIGYQGMIELGNRSGGIDYLTAEMVCENDTFRVDPLGGHPVHEYPLRGSRGDVIGYYAGFIRAGSERMKLVYKSKEDMQAHRDKFALQKNKQGQIFGPWKDHFDSMGLKTQVRELFKWMPRSTELEAAVTADESLRVDIDDPDITHSSRHITPDDIGQASDTVSEAPTDEPYAPTAAEQEEIFRREREGQ